MYIYTSILVYIPTYHIYHVYIIYYIYYLYTHYVDLCLFRILYTTWNLLVTLDHYWIIVSFLPTWIQLASSPRWEGEIGIYGGRWGRIREWCDRTSCWKGSDSCRPWKWQSMPNSIWWVGIRRCFSFIAFGWSQLSGGSKWMISLSRF